MKVIFLDVDGVLNAHEPFHPDVMCGAFHRDKVELLNGVLRRTDARIVLSSAWRYLVHRGEMTLQGMDWLLRSHGMLADRLIGVTRLDTMGERKNPATGLIEPWPIEDERGQQILDWLAANPVDAHVVVDDLDLGIRAAGHPFVQVEGTAGLCKDDAELIEDMLKHPGLAHLLAAPVVFGLRAQGHMPKIEEMLAAGHSWFGIGRAIGWCPETLKRHYELAKGGAK